MKEKKFKDNDSAQTYAQTERANGRSCQVIRRIKYNTAKPGQKKEIYLVRHYSNKK